MEEYSLVVGRDAEATPPLRRPAEGHDQGRVPGQREIRNPGPGPAPHGLARSLRRACGGSLRVAQTVLDRGTLMRRCECQMENPDPDALLRTRQRIHRAIPRLLEDASTHISSH